MKWSKESEVRFHETDPNEFLSPSNVLKAIQEVAMDQTRAEHPTVRELKNQNIVFILSNIRLECYAPICAYDRIVSRTWTCDSKGYNFIRCYEIERDGELIAEAVSCWALVHTTDRKLLKTTDVDLSGYVKDEMLSLSHGNRIHIPAELPLALVGEHTVSYYECDFNRHMNNTNYADILCAHLPDLSTLRVKSVGISYQNEAKLGDTFKIYTARLNGKYCFKTLLPDGKINVEAEIETEME